MTFPASIKAPLAEMVQRLSLPYGLWTCDDGKEILFNREYQPIWERNGHSARSRFGVSQNGTTSPGPGVC